MCVAPAAMVPGSGSEADSAPRLRRLCTPEVAAPLAERTSARRPVLTRSEEFLLRSEIAPPAGLEPATARLEGECSIQLSYGSVPPA